VKKLENPTSKTITPLNKKNSRINLIPILCFGIVTISIILLRSVILIGIPIALFDSFDFYTFALLLSLLQKDKPIQKFLSFVVPYFLGYWGIGIFYIYLGDKIAIFMKFFQSPIATLILQIIGLLLIAVGLFMLSKSIRNKNSDFATLNDSKFQILKTKIKNKYHHYSNFKYVLLGLISSVMYLPFAYPYLGFITTLNSYQLAKISLIFIVLVYSCFFILPYFLLLYFYLRFSDKFDAIFSRIFGKISAFFDNKIVKSLLFLIIGIVLLTWITFF
jgi:cytochrome c biogenesis protein CcdA